MADNDDEPRQYISPQRELGVKQFLFELEKSSCKTDQYKTLISR